MAIQKTEKNLAQRQVHSLGQCHSARDVSRGPTTALPCLKAFAVTHCRRGRLSFARRNICSACSTRRGIYRIDVDFTRDELVSGLADLIKANGVWPCYIPSHHPSRIRRSGRQPLQFAD